MSLDESSNGSVLPKFKVVLLGDAGVGKTSLFLRVKDNEFQDTSPSSIGLDSCFKRLKVNDQEVQVQLWDTAGVERFRTLTRNFYRGAHAVLLVFAMDDPASLFHLSKWEQDARDSAPTAMKFLLGNKTDKQATVTQESIESFASSHNCESAFLTSAKTGQGVTTVLCTVAQRLISLYDRDKYELENSWLEESIHVNQGTPTPKADSSSCC